MDKLEFGEFVETRNQLEEGDLKMHLSAGFIIRAPLGSLIALRNYLRALLGDGPGVGLIHYQHSGPPLFLVHWNDLTNEFKEKMRK